MSLLRSLQAWFGGRSAARLEAAIRLHESGDLAGAEARYNAILRADTRDADATHLLGLIAHQRGEHARAVVQIRAAIALDADKAIYHFNLGNALAALEQPQAAIASFRIAITLAPEHVGARANLAHALTLTGQHRDAAVELRYLQRLQPSAAMHYALAAALIRCADADPATAGAYDEAAALLQLTLQDADAPAETRLALAHCLQQHKHWSEAADQYLAVLLLQPRRSGITAKPTGWRRIFPRRARACSPA